MLYRRLFGWALSGVILGVLAQTIVEATAIAWLSPGAHQNTVSAGPHVVLFPHAGVQAQGVDHMIAVVNDVDDNPLSTGYTLLAPDDDDAADASSKQNTNINASGGGPDGFEVRVHCSAGLSVRVVAGGSLNNPHTGTYKTWAKASYEYNFGVGVAVGGGSIEASYETGVLGSNLTATIAYCSDQNDTSQPLKIQGMVFVTGFEHECKAEATLSSHYQDIVQVGAWSMSILTSRSIEVWDMSTSPPSLATDGQGQDAIIKLS